MHHLQKRIESPSRTSKTIAKLQFAFRERREITKKEEVCYLCLFREIERERGFRKSLSVFFFCLNAMTSTLMPSTAGNAGVTVRDHSLANGGKNGGGSTAISRAAMRWSQDKLGLSLGTTRTWDSRGLKQLWKLIALEATRRSVMVSDLDQTQENDQNSINIVSNCISTTKSPSSPSEYGEEKHLPKEKVRNWKRRRE